MEKKFLKFGSHLNENTPIQKPLAVKNTHIKVLNQITTVIV